MISNGKDLFKLVDSVLKKDGYIKRGDTWYKNHSECLCYYNLGKSFYGGKYGSDFGCFLKELYPISFFSTDSPEYALSSLRLGFSFFVQDKNEIKKLFNLGDSSYFEFEREAQITRLLEGYVLPILNQISTKKGISEFYSNNPLARHFMDIKLKDTLGILSTNK